MHFPHLEYVARIHVGIHIGIGDNLITIGLPLFKSCGNAFITRNILVVPVIEMILAGKICHCGDQLGRIITLGPYDQVITHVEGIIAAMGDLNGIISPRMLPENLANEWFTYILLRQEGWFIHIKEYTIFIDGGIVLRSNNKQCSSFRNTTSQ